ALTNIYDRVRYPSVPFPQYHPEPLASLAALYGTPIVPLASARVLEFGCGEGVNLMCMAQTAPRAEFVGVDLAARAIATAKQTARTAGLSHVQFQVQDIALMNRARGRFDYVFAHGVYAWVPAAAREALTRVAGDLLSDDGLAVISYNARPGARFREAIRDMLLFATE